MDEKTKEDLKNLVKQTESSQLNLEQSAFTALNQQDKVLNLTKNSMDKVFELLSLTEGVSFGASEVMTLVSELRKTGREMILVQTVEHFFDLLNQQQVLFDEVSTMIKNILDEQEGSAEIVHNMEEEIAIHRSDIESLLLLILNNMGKGG